MTISRHGFYKASAASPPAFADSAPLYQDISTAASTWDRSATSITTASNCIVVIPSWEQSVTLSGIVVRNAADDTTLATLAAIGAVATGDAGTSNAHAYGLYGISINETCIVRATFSGSAAGAMAIYLFSDATKTPDVTDNDGASGGVTSIANSLTIAGDGDEKGIIVSGLNLNSTLDDALVATGGLNATPEHYYEGADGGQAAVFSHNTSTPHSNPEAPGWDWSAASGSNRRCAVKSVLVE